MVFLFPITLFLSAVLFFSIQPMVAKALLPVYGGSPSVWTICMLFFQSVLLVSYGYVVLLQLFRKPIFWRITHSVLIVLSFFMIPILFHPLLLEISPEWGILYSLLAQLGLPLLVIGASAPLLQFAYSQTRAKGASDPYFLYISSNLGSLLSLLLYPWVIEQFIGLKNQFYLWTLGYFIDVVLLFFVLYSIDYQSLEQSKKQMFSWPWESIFYWVLLGFIPCSLMLGVTLYITTDIAATPLFWILPLALYLLSFVLTFTSKPFISFHWIAQNCILFLIFVVIGFILSAEQMKVWQTILFNLLSFFMLTLLCNSQLYLTRPKPQSLPLFYFCMSLGGAFAGVFNGIIAPHWFKEIYEYPLAILLSVLFLPQLKRTGGWWVPFVVLIILLSHYILPNFHLPGGFSSFQLCAFLALIVLVVWQKSKTSLFLSLLLLFGFIYSPHLNESILLQTRNFYGVKRIIEKQGVHALINQSTMHGLQDMSDKQPNGMSSYYGAVNLVVRLMQQQWNPLSATLIGLGAGTMICQFRNEDRINIIEIDQQVIDIARNPRFFTYLQDCPAHTTIIKNDGRLAVTQLNDHSQDLLVIDAFNSDAIPVHLLTLEAFKLYKQKINPEGGILINLSNRHLQLLPVINAAGPSLEMLVFYIHSKGHPASGQFPSEWAFLTSSKDLGFKIMQDKNWHLANNQDLLWTDDFSNIIPLLKW